MWRDLTSATTTNLEGMLLGKFLVGTGLGMGPPIAALYVSGLSGFVWRTNEVFIRMATCRGLLGALFIKTSSQDCRLVVYIFLVSTIPAMSLALAMHFCVESPLTLASQVRKKS